MSLRELRNRSRLSLHQHMMVLAYYIAGDEAPVPCSVRVHRRIAALGDVKGTSFGYATSYEPTPQIIFLASEISAPARSAIVSVEPGEAYRIDNVQPRDGLTITTEVVQLSEAEAAGLPWPLVYGAAAADLTLTADALGEV